MAGIAEIYGPSPGSFEPFPGIRIIEHESIPPGEIRVMPSDKPLDWTAAYRSNPGDPLSPDIEAQITNVTGARAALEAYYGVPFRYDFEPIASEYPCRTIRVSLVPDWGAMKGGE